MGWGSDDVPLDLITLLMLRHALGWGGVGWGSDDVPLDLITLLMLRHVLGWGGVGWDSAACFSLLQKERMSRIGSEPKKIGDLSQDKDWLKV